MLGMEQNTNKLFGTRLMGSTNTDTNNSHTIFITIFFKKACQDIRTGILEVFTFMWAQGNGQI